MTAGSPCYITVAFDRPIVAHACVPTTVYAQISRKCVMARSEPIYDVVLPFTLSR